MNNSIVNWNSSGPINLTPKEFAFANTFVCVSLEIRSDYVFIFFAEGGEWSRKEKNLDCEV